MTVKIFEIDLNDAELVYITGQLGLGSLALINAPEGNRTVKNGDKEYLQDTAAKLAERNYLQVTPEKTVVLDTAVAAIVGTLAYTEFSLVVTRVTEQDRDPYHRHIHFASGLIVEHEVKDDIHYLTAVRDLKVLNKRLKNLLGLKRQSTVNTTGCRLPSSAFRDIPLQIAAEGADRGIELLQELDVPTQIATALAKAIDRPLAQSVIHGYAWNEGEATLHAHINLLEEPYGLWVFHAYEEAEEKWVEITPCDAATAYSKVQAFVYSIVPPNGGP